jgi:hypothetical protein
MHAILRYQWNIMLAALGALEVWLAATAVDPARLLGILGGLLVLAAAALRPRPWRLALVAAGALPFAVLTWWSLTTPLLALLALGFAAAAARTAGRPA